jgi:predicted RNA-binding protein with TRAM domain
MPYGDRQGGYGDRQGGYRPRPMGDSDSGFAPVKVGEELDVKIEAVGEKGDGIARKRGFVLFVPSTKEGDEVRIRITKVLRKVGFAEVIGAPQGPVGADKKEEREEQQEARPEEAPREEDPVDTENFGEEDEMGVPPLPEEDTEEDK